MDRLNKTVLALVAAAALAGVAMAQDRPRVREAAKDRPQLAPAGQRLAAAADELMEKLKALDLTADQRPQIRQILDTHRQAMENWVKEHRQELQDLRGQLANAGDDAQRKEIRAKLAKLEADRQQLVQKMHRAIREILTPEQQTKFDELIREGVARGVAELARIRRALAALDLSADQKAQVEKILQDARTQAEQAKDPAEKAKILRTALQEIRTKVLSAEQAEKLAKLLTQEVPRPMAMLEKLNLSAEQKEQVQKILQEAREKAAAAEDPQAKAQIIKAAWEKIQKDVLTDQQRQQLQELRKADNKQARSDRPQRPIRERVRERRAERSTRV
jgi:Spy/CpxP family protein refolding chaperone